MPSNNWKSYRGQVAALSRSRAADDPELLTARRELKAARLAEHVERTLAAAPPLTAEQRARVARLLAPVGGDAV